MLEKADAGEEFERSGLEVAGALVLRVVGVVEAG